MFFVVNPYGYNSSASATKTRPVSDFKNIR